MGGEQDQPKVILGSNRVRTWLSTAIFARVDLEKLSDCHFGMQGRDSMAQTGKWQSRNSGRVTEDNDQVLGFALENQLWVGDMGIYLGGG
ncbi:predicted protein [Uncinocarpus reesii 1704]|uniref:Uncharacterized protein n=1 Tax=Uncinocarpus reesii (strain UAMH 1704) TaxID=336963 RepID=C4JPV0_UNCRE|nr:uncharacterized protein UREG_04593 [Uncinocarpus reesii 1704]EEP79747.1 predicted protein [Uncinocarpus reesii 1704]